jgi:hypothetical protein
VDSGEINFSGMSGLIKAVMMENSAEFSFVTVSCLPTKGNIVGIELPMLTWW